MATPGPADPAQRDPSRGVQALRAELAARVMRDRRPVRPMRTEFGHPQEFDESGFPIPQRAPAFVERVRRLLAG